MALNFYPVKAEEFNTIKEHVAFSDLSISDGVASVTKTVYLHFKRADGGLLTAEDYANAKFEARKSVFFPQKNAVLAQDASFKFSGNGTITMWSQTAQVICLELEYTSGSSGSSGGGTQNGDSNTPPYELGVTEIDFTPEINVVPMTYGYNEEGKKIPTVNSAGDPILAETEQYRGAMRFTYYLKESGWKNNYSIAYMGTSNSRDITILDVPIDKKRALLKEISAKFLKTYDDDGKEKWRYWSITVTILAGENITHFLDIGDRAFFKDISYSDDLITEVITLNGTLPSTGTSSQIVRWRKFKKTTMASGKYSYNQTGDVIIGSWDQFLQFRGSVFSYSAAKISKDANYIGETLEAQYEQLESIPLTKEGFVDLTAIQNKTYPTKDIYKRCPKSWAALNLPKTMG